MVGCRHAAAVQPKPDLLPDGLSSTFKTKAPSATRGRPCRLASRGGLMALALNIGKCTLLGNYRENNEDSIDVKQFPDMTVCLVADGMGGQAAGEIASKRAVEIVPRELKKRLSGAQSLDDNKSSIRRSIVQANEEIMAMAAMDRDLKNMGTTLVLAVWRKGSAIMYVAGVGDSRAYLVRGNK